MSPDTQNPHNVNNKLAWMSELKGFQQKNQSNNPSAFVVSAHLLAINNTASIQDMPLVVINGLPST